MLLGGSETDPLFLLEDLEPHLNEMQAVGGYYTFGTGGPEDGVERFWRNILGGSAKCSLPSPGRRQRPERCGQGCDQSRAPS